MVWHCLALHCTALHFTALHCTALLGLEHPGSLELGRGWVTPGSQAVAGEGDQPQHGAGLDNLAGNWDLITFLSTPTTLVEGWDL